MDEEATAGDEVVVVASDLEVVDPGRQRAQHDARDARPLSRRPPHLVARAQPEGRDPARLARVQAVVVRPADKERVARRRGAETSKPNSRYRMLL
jgi:hypothetical protein